MSKSFNNSPTKDSKYYEMSETQLKQELKAQTPIPPLKIQSTQLQTKFDRTKGLIFIILNVVCGSIYSIFGKYAYSVIGIPPMYDLFWRCLVLTAIFAFQAKYSNTELLSFPPDLRKLLIMRGVFGCTSMVAIVTAIHIATLSKAIVVCYLCPIITAIGAYVFLDEKLPKFELLGIVTSFGGLLLIMIPSMNQSTKDQEHSKDTSLETLGLFFALLNAFLTAGVFITLRKISSRITYVISGFYWSVFNLMLAPLTIIVFSITPDKPLLLNPGFLIFYHVAVIITTYGYQAFLAKAMQYEKASRVAPFTYLTIVFTLASDFIFFDPQLKWTDILGSVLIIGYSFTIAFLRSINFIK